MYYPLYSNLNNVISQEHSEVIASYLAQMSTWTQVRTTDVLVEVECTHLRSCNKLRIYIFTFKLFMDDKNGWKLNFFWLINQLLCPFICLWLCTHLQYTVLQSSILWISYLVTASFLVNLGTTGHLNIATWCLSDCTVTFSLISDVSICYSEDSIFHISSQMADSADSYHIFGMCRKNFVKHQCWHGD